jgi:hypothetical protein
MKLDHRIVPIGVGTAVLTHSASIGPSSYTA